jgi:hypothetical protein
VKDYVLRTDGVPYKDKGRCKMETKKMNNTVNKEGIKDRGTDLAPEANPQTAVTKNPFWTSSRAVHSFRYQNNLLLHYKL